MTDDVEVDRRYPVGQLWQGWQFLSPAQRWETVESIEQQPGYFTKVWTAETGPDFGWFLSSSTMVEAVPPRTHPRGEVVVRLLDAGRGHDDRSRIWVVIAAHAAVFPWDDYTDLPVYAEHLGQGLGWKLVYRPGGTGDLTEEQFTTKDQAKRRVRNLAREFAKGLGLKFGTDMGSP